MITLEGKIALVTGGGAGIGLAIAEAYGELGAKVAIAEINPKNLAGAKSQLEAAGVETLALEADVRDPAQVKSVIGAIDARYGRLDVLVNNVGLLYGGFKPFADSTPEEWEGNHQLNFAHILHVTHQALPLLKKAAPGASIINLSSVEGLRGCPLGVVYTAYKWAVIGFTKSLACELGPDGIRVNSIATETTETESIQIVAGVKPEHRDHLRRWFPMGRYGKPEDSAGAAVYLATSLSEWTTGETVVVDGGALAQAGWRQSRDGRWTNSPIIDDAHRLYGPKRND